MMKGFLVMELEPSVPKELPQNPFDFAKPRVPIGAAGHSTDDVQDALLASAATGVGEESGWAAVLRHRGPPVPVADITNMKSLWLHIGYCNFKNMIWSGLHLLKKGWTQNAEGQDLEIELSLPNPVKCYRCFEFLHKHIDFPKAYTLKFWALQTKGARFSKANMAPKQVLVTAFPHIPAIQVWKGSFLEAKEEEERKKNKEEKERKKREKLAAPKQTLRECLHSKKKRKRSTDSAELIVDDDDRDHAGVASHESNLHDDQDQDSSSDSSSSSTNESGTDSDDDDHGNEIPSEDSDSNSSSSSSSDEELRDCSDYAPDTDVDEGVADEDTSAPAAPSSSSGAAIAPVPASGSGLPREKATCITIPGFGELRYHEKTQNIVAFCHTHKTTHDCRRGRTVTANSSRAGQGRPIGLLVAWLLDPDSHGATPDAKRFVHPFDARLAARRHFNALDGSTVFAQCERGKFETETYDEPQKIL